MSGYMFHFMNSKSPYSQIVLHAQGTIHADDQPISSTMVENGMTPIVVFNDKAIFDSSVETEVIVNSRQFSDDVLKWVVNGWIPISEQELLRVMLFENDKDVIMRLNKKRMEKEQERKRMKEENERNMNDEETDEETEATEEEEKDVTCIKASKEKEKEIGRAHV